MYSINVDPNYYAGDIFGNDKPRVLVAVQGVSSGDKTVIHADDKLVLATAEDAQELCDALNDHPNGYVCAHNQYAAPEYTPKPYTGKTPPVTVRQAKISLCLDV